MTETQIRLKKRVEDLFDIDDLFTQSRQPKYVDARMMFSEYLRTIDRLSITEAAKVFKRPHTAICHYRTRFNDALEYDRYLRDIWDDLVNNRIYLDNDELKDRVKQLDHINRLIESLEDKSKTKELITKIENLIKGYNK